MFKMKIEKQMNIKDRTLLLGIPESGVFHDSVYIDDKNYKLIGVTMGCPPPFFSLEIERTNNNFVGKIITNKKAMYWL